MKKHMVYPIFRHHLQHQSSFVPEPRPNHMAFIANGFARVRGPFVGYLGGITLWLFNIAMGNGP